MSGGNKAIELQLQIQQNAEDLHSFMKELSSWETEIKNKDEQLRTEGLKEVQVCSCCKHEFIADADDLPLDVSSCLSLL